MRIHDCPVCGGNVFFDNLACACGAEVAYDPDTDTMLSDAPHCANRAEIGCNWRAAPTGALCASCTLTHTHPDLSVAGNSGLWARAEAAKRWVLVNLRALGWFAPDDPGPRPSFDLLAEATASGPSNPMTGHADGHIVVNVAEADPSTLVSRREWLGEPYRTLIGHFRHELAHFLFLRRLEDPDFPARFRALFGDERADYGAALERHYAAGPPADWSERHISAYASCHPHEDWAETAAHVLHLLDMADSARAAGLKLSGDGRIAMPDHSTVGMAFSLGLAVNHLNRSMGIDDIYPFAVSPAVRAKMDFALDALVRADG